MKELRVMTEREGGMKGWRDMSGTQLEVLYSLCQYLVVILPPDQTGHEPHYPMLPHQLCYCCPQVAPIAFIQATVFTTPPLRVMPQRFSRILPIFRLAAD